MFGPLNKVAFLVGGAVRDELFGIPPEDHDWVIEKTTPAEYEKIFPSHKRVGDSFPVYLHPELGEVALARTEVCTGNAYQDYAVETNVDILTDLSRRDYTIGSLAKHYVTGELIDPFDGQADIENRILRCVNPHAFSDDPLRLLRGCRFVSRFRLSIEPETKRLMTESVEKLGSVTAERIEKELRKAYEQSEKPSVFFRTLDEIGGLYIHFAELEKAKHILAGPVQYHGNKTVLDHMLDAFDRARQKGHSFSEGIASLLHDISKIASPVSDPQHHYGHENWHRRIALEFFSRHRFDAHTMELALCVGEHHMYPHNFHKIKKPVKLIRFFKEIRRHVDSFVRCCDNDHELSVEQLDMFKLLNQTFTTTIIDIPDTIKKKGRDSIVEFVEQQYVNAFKTVFRRVS